MKRYLIGAGGHATVLSDIARKNKIEISGVFIDKNAKNITIYPVIDEIKNIINYKEDEFIFAFGNVKIRKQMEQEFSKYGIKWFSLIDESAIISEDVTIGKGTVIMPGAIINAGAKIGDHAIINTGVIVEHGCNIENHVHMSPRSVICGNSIIRSGTWIGAGSTIIDEIEIGSDSIVGAGSVVVNDVPSNQTVMGVPAREKVKSMKR
ncbi:MAG: acetyltransferase [Firmicutes bacterium]|nr:acetyltransferase [Bacillota bacterium]